jgi:hypothetical protein
VTAHAVGAEESWPTETKSRAMSARLVRKRS